MSSQRPRLVLIVEGHSDVKSVPILVKKILKNLKPWDVLIFEERDEPIRIGEISNLMGKAENQKKWIDNVIMAGKRSCGGAVLLIIDGDKKGSLENKTFCPAEFARILAERAKAASSASHRFSLGCVFACQEFESWLLAGIESLAGLPLPNGLPGVKANAKPPEKDLDVKPKKAKEALKEYMINNIYNENRDQPLLTELVNINSIRPRSRSFRRLESALNELIEAVRSEQHIISRRRA
jgi:hypothetical protein